MKAILCLLLGSLLLHSSCMLLLGVDKHYESATQKQVDKFARKLKTGAYTQLYFDSIALDTAGKIPYKPRLGNPIPQFKMFDNRSMKEISAWGICEGPTFLFHVYKSFPPRNINPLDTNTVLVDCTKYLRNSDNSPYQPQLTQYNYSIYAYWHSGVRSPSKTMVRKLKRYVRRHKDKRIALIFVTLDTIKN